MINVVTLTGRLTATPELKQTKSGTYVTSFTIATDFYNKGENVTSFIDCVAWRTTAEFLAKWFSKGAEIGIVGRLQSRNYEDRNGNNRKAVEVVVSEVSFVGKREGSNNRAEYNPNVNTQTYDTPYGGGAGNFSSVDDFVPVEDDDDGDLPF